MSPSVAKREHSVMGVAVVKYYTLSDTPYALWVRGELADELHLPNDGSRVEVIGGEIVVSPSPGSVHGLMVKAIDNALHEARLNDPGFRWDTMHTCDLNLEPVRDGSVPDLIVLDKNTVQEFWEDDRKLILPHQVEAVVEVTSPSNASNDRPPRPLQTIGTKWSDYAHTGIPYYLLVERDPRMPGITLYGEPDMEAGTYQTLHIWQFGEAVKLPEPFGVEIDTGRWTPWKK